MNSANRNSFSAMNRCEWQRIWRLRGGLKESRLVTQKELSRPNYIEALISLICGRV